MSQQATLTIPELRDQILADLLARYTFVFTVDKTLWVYNASEGIYEPNGEMLVKTEVEKAMGLDYRKQDYAEILDRVEAKTYRNDMLNPNEDHVCVENGVLNLLYFTSEPDVQEQFHPLKPWSQVFELNQKLPIEYNPEATCPLIEKFFHEVLKSEQDVQAMYEWFGYHFLVGQKMQKASLWIGIGKNGKTVMGNLLKAFVGKENLINLTLEQICNDREASPTLYGKMASVGSEIQKAMLKDVVIFQKLVGEDRISARHHHQRYFEFENSAKLTFYGNKTPQTQNLDSEFAFYRRFLIFEFPNIFHGEKEDKELIYKLTSDEELSGLLNKALEGLARLLKNGKFSNEQPWELIKEQYLILSDIEHAFIDLEIENVEDSFETTETVYVAYKEFCKKHDKQPCTKNTLTIRVQQYANARVEFRKINKETIRVYSGICLKNKPIEKPTEQQTLVSP